MGDGDVVSGIQLYEDYEIATRDRLSELPDSLILSILSLMETRDVVKTTFLSKRWNNLWTTLPCLRFKWFAYNFLQYLDGLESFKNSVNRALALWKGTKILKFSLNFVFDKSFSSDVDSWLLFAIEKQVEDLYVNLAGYNRSLYSVESEYNVPQRLYSCSSIVKLSLDNCILRIDGERVHWNRLKNLYIVGNESLIEEDAMNKILSGAPQLEILKLGFFDINDNLNIESTSLKRLTIRRYHCMDGEANNNTLRISAPNLETLEIFGVPYSKCLLNVPCVSNANLGFYHQDYYIEDIMRKVFLSICCVENITLSAWCIKVLVELKKKGKVVEFSNAKILAFKVSAAHEILDVLEIFPKLMMLILEFDASRPHFLLFSNVDDAYNYSFPNNPSLDLPHLRKVEITLHPLETSIIQIAEILLKNAHVLEKMVFRPHAKSYGAVGGSSFLAEELLLSMSRSSPIAEVIVIKDP